MKLEIKICGLTNALDAGAALAAGADYLGFVLYKGSPRAVTAEALSRILQEIGGSAKAVGVFVNASPDEVRKTVMQCRLAAVQLHGDEAATDFSDMPVPVWRAVSMGAGSGWHPPPAAWPAAVRYVVDAAAPGRYGGTGTTADWTQAAMLARQVPIMLAGGLRPENVEEAVKMVRPLGVDVSSGVESRPGLKSHPSLLAFIAAVRRVSTSLESA